MKDKKTSKKNIPAKKETKKVFPEKKGTWLVYVILILTTVAFSPVLNADFVNWDDMEYVYENNLIRSFSNLGKMFTEPVQGNTHPLTMISLAVNYSISGNEAWSYHLFNFLLHLANTLLVFLFAKRLSGGNNIIALTTSLLFGLHPMHVESVAWVSERKDVLYSFFFILGMISYLKYTEAKSAASYLMSILLLVFSLLSKPAAVVFPFALLMIDILQKRKWEMKIVYEKIPFFVLAGIMGIITLKNQSGIGATQGQEYFAIGERIFFGFYGFFMYLVKLIVPINLAAFYPFPPVNETLPLIYYLSPAIFIAIVILCIKTFKRLPVLTFGFGFYFVNLMLVLQFFIVGSAIIADRYTYIPYIGIFYIIGFLLDRWQNHSLSKSTVYIVGAGIILSVMSFQQSKHWKNSTTLWEHAIEVHPSYRAYNNRGLVYRKEKNNKKALEFYNKAIELNPTDAEIYTNRGNIYSEARNFELALKDYNKALAIKPDYPPALDNRGALYGMNGKIDLALKDFDRVIAIKPDHMAAYPNRATAYLDAGKYEQAIKDFYTYLEYKPNDVDILNSIGVAYQRMKKYDKAIEVYNRAISIKPNPVFYLNRSFSWNGLGKIEEARKDAITAKKGGANVSQEYLRYLGVN